MCGSTSAQNNVLASQQQNMLQAAQQAQSIFGDNQAAYKALMNTFNPVVAAGPNQQGFGAQELSNMNSQAITNTGQQYRNAKQALGDQQAAQGGGTAVLPGGANIAQNASLAEAAANQTSNQLAGITQENYATGRQNWLNAASGLAGAGNVFGTSTAATNALTGSSSAAGETANQIAQAANSPWQAAIGAAGAVAGQAAGAVAGGGGGSAPESPSIFNGAQDTLFNSSTNTGSGYDFGIGLPGSIPTNPPGLGF